jgi:hypothetical protein
MAKIDMSNSSADICGTSLQAGIEMYYPQMVGILGEPNTDGDGYKVDAEWQGTIDGQPFTVYNYKDGKNYLGAEGIPLKRLKDWHIGAKNKETGIKVKQYLMAEFNKLPPAFVSKKDEKARNINQKFIEDLKEFEYQFRDGMLFSEEQKEEIARICQQIIQLAEE